MLAPCQPQLLPDLCHERQVLIELSCLVEPCLLAGLGAAGDRGNQQLGMLTALLGAAEGNQLDPCTCAPGSLRLCTLFGTEGIITRLT